MSRADRIVDQLRSRILADLHAGRLDPADRLPSIRSVADEIDADHRTVGRAYRALEQEGLVEIRSRSGVYVAPQDHLGRDGTLLAETAEWMAGISVGAWTRRIPLTDLPDLVGRCLAPDSVRCGLVESVADARLLLARELTEDFGLQVEQIAVSGGYDSLPPEEEARVTAALDSLDFVATTVYHAQAVESLARSRKIPVVVLRYAPRWLEETHRRLQESPATLMIVLDPEGSRRRIEPLELGDRVRFVSLDEWDGTTPKGVEVFSSIPAAERLDGGGPPALALPGPALSTASARMLSEMIVKTNLEREEGACVPP